jgi:hypothetical protein
LAEKFIVHKNPFGYLSAIFGKFPVLFPVTRALWAQLDTRTIHPTSRGADFPVCRVAGFQTRVAAEVSSSANLEIGDTAGLETGTTVRVPGCARASFQNALGVSE